MIRQQKTPNISRLAGRQIISATVRSLTNSLPDTLGDGEEEPDGSSDCVGNSEGSSD